VELDVPNPITHHMEDSWEELTEMDIVASIKTVSVIRHFYPN